MSLTKVSYSMIDGAEYNVLDYGVAPSNTAANNATALTALIAAASAGSVIYFPSGTYNFDAAISITKKLVFVGAPANSRAVQSATIAWTGVDGIAWATGPKVFTVAQGATGMGTTFLGLGFTTDKDYVTFIDGTATFNLLIQQCQFVGVSYTKAITLKESASGANDGAFWTRIIGNNFANTWVEVLNDSNATYIVENNFWAEIDPLPGTSLYILGDINSIYVQGNFFEGTWDASASAVDATLIQQFVFTNNRIENYSGGSAKFNIILGGLIEGNVFNTPYTYGGTRATSAHNLGQGFTEINNQIYNKTDSTAVEVTNLNAVVPGKNLFIQGAFNVDWSISNCSYTIIQDGSEGPKTPVVLLDTPTTGSASIEPNNMPISMPEIQLAIQNETFVTAVFIVKAKSTNTATSVVGLNTGDAFEYWDIPKDDEWHVIKVNRRMLSSDTVLRPTVFLAYASAFNAADELWVAGIGVYAGQGAMTLPYFDGWSTDPATASNTQYFSAGEVARRVSPASGSTIGWVCTTPGSPGTWKSFGTIA